MGISLNCCPSKWQVATRYLVVKARIAQELAAAAIFDNASARARFDVQTVLGRSALSYQQFAADYASAFS